jgi:RIO kinase 1
MFDEDTFEPFLADGLITNVIGMIKGGKEASIYLCRAGNTARRSLLVVKAYRPRQHRNFKNDAIYKDGRVINKRRIRVAVEKKTRFGRTIDDDWWVHREYEALSTLHAAGADVPEPLASSERGILMEYLGGDEAPAPQLLRVSLDRDEAEMVFDRLMRNVELALANDLVHADLSPYNVLFWRGRAWMIDLPQCVDARRNPNARALLERDVDHLCRHFARYGVESDPSDISRDLWGRYAYARL